MNRNTYNSEYTVPSLSLASSRSKKNVPTKDIIQSTRPVQGKLRNQIIDRINHPPIFTSKNIRQSKISIQSNSTSQIRNESSRKIEPGNLSRNVYLSQEEPSTQNQITFRTTQNDQNINNNLMRRPPSGYLLRNPQSTRNVGIEIQKRLQSKKIDINKSLFDRRIKKLLQQADFYDKQLMETYTDNFDQMNKQLQQLQSYRKDNLNLKINSSLIGII